MALSARDQKEKDDLDKLDDLRKSYLAKKGKKPTPKNIKVDSRSAREKKDAADYKKLEVLRKRYLTNVKKSVRPKAKKINSVKEIDTVIKEIKKPTISIAVVTVKPKNTEASISDAQKKTQTDKARSKSKSSLSDAQKRSQVRKSKSSLSDAQKKTQTDKTRSKSKSSISDAQKRSQVRKSKSSLSDEQKKTQTRKRKIPEGRGINKKVPKSVSRMTLAEKEFYFNINNKDNPSIKKGTKKSSAGTFVTYPQFTLAEYLKMSKRDRYLVGLPESDKRLSRNSRNILTFTPIKN